jgi:lysophospholipase L1-like esterase
MMASHVKLAIMAVLALGSMAMAASDPNAPIDESAYSGKIKVACVGDSITAGSGTTPTRKFPNAYPSQLQRMLGEKYDARNFGVGGTTLLNHGDRPYQQQKALASAKAFLPDVVVIMLGTNDTKPQNWKLKDEFATDYRDLVKQFAALQSKPRIFVCHPCFVPGEGNYGINEPDVLDEIPTIDALAGELKLGVIDIHGTMKGHGDLIPDRIHPNNAGATIMAATVYKALTGKEYSGPETVVIVATQASQPATVPAN